VWFKGVTQETLEKAAPGIPLEVLAECLSYLSQEGRISLLTHSKTGEIIYRAVPLHIYKRYVLTEHSSTQGILSISIFI
jgi:hypothetical protein